MAHRRRRRRLPQPDAKPRPTPDQSLADMAQRLRSGVAQAAVTEPAAAPAPPPRRFAADAAAARPAERQAARADAKPNQAQGKTLYDSLEQEMASLLGRPTQDLMHRIMGPPRPVHNGSGLCSGTFVLGDAARRAGYQHQFRPGRRRRRRLNERIIQLIALMTVLSLAPSILVMMTSFTRIVVVLSLLRTALGTATAPPNSVVISLALFLTAFVMGPVLHQVYDAGVKPLVANQITVDQAFERGAVPLRALHGKERPRKGPAAVRRYVGRASRRTSRKICRCASWSPPS